MAVVVLALLAVDAARVAPRYAVAWWWWYMAIVGIALYYVFDVLLYGLEEGSVFLAALFVWLAVHTWVADIRGRRGYQQEGL